MAALREVPFGLYYGSVEATPLFVMLAGLYAERTGDWEFFRSFGGDRECARLDRWPGDPDGDGFVEYQSRDRTRLANQGWKDSADSIFHADGRLAEGPIALAEVQAYVYAAKCLASRCARRLAASKTPIGWTRRQPSSRDASRRHSGARKLRPMRLRSMAGSGPVACAPRMPDSFCSPALRPPIGRARSGRVSCGRILFWLGHPHGFQRGARFNPMSYHNGSVWPHDNALIALGLARYGLSIELERVFRGLFDAATYMDLRRLPELFCGFQRRRSQRPNALSDRLFASGVGQRHAVHADTGLPRPRI